MRLTQLFLISSLLFAAPYALADSIPTPGSSAPSFSLPDQAGKMRRLEEWHGKWLILYFYPKDDTSGCTAEAQAFRDATPLLTAQNAQVVGVSLDSVASHQEFAQKHQLNFPILVDREGSAARRYGALLNLGVMKFAKRVSFIIDPDGRIAKSYSEVDVTRHAAQVLADLKELKR